MIGTPFGDIRVFAGAEGRRAARSIPCVLGRELKINPGILAHYCFSDLSPVAFDLALVAGAVAFADRVVPRALSTGWSRNLRLTVPVISERWHRQRVQESLLEALHLLTGDSWEIRFRLNRRSPERSPQSVLKLGHRCATAMPYSDGLDSFAAARLLQQSLDADDRTLILVTTGARADVDEAQARRRVRVAVPFSFSEADSSIRLREPSYRSRAFVYGSLAGLAVNLAGGTHVIVPESGQSSLGPSLCPVGEEALDLRSHPRFTQKLAGFLSSLLDAPIVFEHPRLWSTKGETLAELKELGLVDGWQRTRSCPRSPRHVRLRGAKVHCGVCAACLLRRQSLFRAELCEPEPYQWPHLGAASLNAATATDARPTNDDDLCHATCGVLCMEYFARLARDPNALSLREAVADIPDALGSQEEISRKLRRLICAHQSEWGCFVSSLGKESFVNHLLGKIL